MTDSVGLLAGEDYVRSCMSVLICRLDSKHPIGYYILCIIYIFTEDKSVPFSNTFHATVSLLVVRACDRNSRISKQETSNFHQFNIRKIFLNIKAVTWHIPYTRLKLEVFISLQLLSHVGL